MMTQDQLFALIEFCINIGVQLGSGTHFCEISTNLRNEIPNLNPSVIELVRDAFYPIQRKTEGPLYKVVGSVNGTEVFVKDGFYSTFEAEKFISSKKNEGFKSVIWRIYHR